MAWHAMHDSAFYEVCYLVQFMELESETWTEFRVSAAFYEVCSLRQFMELEFET